MKFAVARYGILQAGGVLACSVFLFPPCLADSVDVVVRRAPYVVSTVSTKSEKAWAICRYCGSKTSYERTYKWDVYNHVWNETTDLKTVPDVCRRCRSKVQDQAKLDARERELDRQIEYYETKVRISNKQEQLRKLRSESRGVEK